jgi:hypothetical protein
VKIKILTKIFVVFIAIIVLIVAPVVFVPNAISNASTQSPTQSPTVTTQTTTAPGITTPTQTTTTPTQTTTTSGTTTPTFTPTLHGRSVDIYFNDRLATWGDALPFIQSIPPSRTMVPIRFFSESIDAEVNWDGVNKEVTVKVDAILTYDHMARQVKMRVGSDQAEVIVGNNVKTVVLDASVWQESEYPWRTYAPLRFISECLGAKVSWAGVGSPSKIFRAGPLNHVITLTQDEVCIVFWFPVKTEDYLVVPGERYGRLELRWSADQVMTEAQMEPFLDQELVQTYQNENDGVLKCVVHSGKGIMKLAQGYLGSAPWGAGI